MKRFLSILLVAVMLCTMAVSMVSCFASMESIEEKGEELEKEGGYVCTKVGNTITVTSTDFDESCIATEYEDKDDAVKAYDELKEIMDKAEEEDPDSVKDAYLKRKGNIVIYGTKDLCKKVV